VLAAIAGLFYLLGYQLQTADASRLGIPRHLLPETSTEVTIALGFLVILALCGVAILLSLLALVGLKVLPSQTANRVAEYFRSVVQQHPRFCAAIGAFCGAALVCIVVFWVPMGAMSGFDDSCLPKVLAIEPKDNAGLIGDVREFRFLSRKGSWVILKRAGKKEYLFLREENVSAVQVAAD
jgi:hypothetical protein